MATALVLGGAGFIGTAVAAALRAEGANVALAGGGSDRLTRERIAALAPTQLVVYCAGTSSVAAAAADPTGEFVKTVAPLEQLVEHMARWPAARLVLVSSAAVYGNAVVPTPETAPCAPVSIYGEHKRACEELCSAAPFPTTIVRLFSVYGPGLRKQLLWDACVKARAGTARFAGTGDERRDFLHVSDAARLVVAAAAQSGIVNGGSGTGVAVREVVAQICAAFGVAAEFTGEQRAGDPPHYVADISRARALGWAPRIALAQGIAEYVAWFREQG